MKKLIYAPVPEQQIIYIDGEVALINNNKVIYFDVNNLNDILYLYMILDEWQLADIYKRNIIDTIIEIYDQEKKNR